MNMENSTNGMSTSLTIDLMLSEKSFNNILKQTEFQKWDVPMILSMISQNLS